MILQWSLFPELAHEAACRLVRELPDDRAEEYWAVGWYSAVAARGVAGEIYQAWKDGMLVSMEKRALSVLFVLDCYAEGYLGETG